MSTPGLPIPCTLAEPAGCCTTPPPTEYCIVEWSALCSGDVWGTPFPFSYCTPTLPIFPQDVWRKDGLGGASLWTFGVGPCPACDPGTTLAGPTGPCVDPITTTPPPLLVNVTWWAYIWPNPSVDYGTTGSATIDDNVYWMLTLTNNSSITISYSYTNIFGSGSGTLLPGANFSFSAGDSFVGSISWNPL